jgi:hypothetical protein
MARRAVDERGFELARRLRDTYGGVPLSEFKAIVREQFHTLLIDEAAALAAIPAMLPKEAELRRKGLELIEQLMAARGELSAEDRKRLAEVAGLFGVTRGSASPSPPTSGLRRASPGASVKLKSRRPANSVRGDGHRERHEN